MWANIAIKGDNYLVIGQYKTKEKAESKLKKDVSQWVSKNENKELFRLCRPFSFDTREVATREGVLAYEERD